MALEKRIVWPGSRCCSAGTKRQPPIDLPSASRITTSSASMLRRSPDRLVMRPRTCTVPCSASAIRSAPVTESSSASRFPQRSRSAICHCAPSAAMPSQPPMTAAAAPANLKAHPALSGVPVFGMSAARLPVLRRSAASVSAKSAGASLATGLACAVAWPVACVVLCAGRTFATPTMSRQVPLHCVQRHSPSPRSTGLPVLRRAYSHLGQREAIAVNCLFLPAHSGDQVRRNQIAAANA